ncbi:MAG: aminotransferase class I/II-fold pyridoxal phosphate-dependent enzyme [Verrucomicrobiales bacterium]
MKAFPCSSLGERLTAPSSIGLLMADLAAALASGDMINMGGGNPAHIPAFEQLVQARWMELGQEGLASALGDYDGPKGSESFREALAEFLNTHYGWSLTRHHIVLVAGSQTGFFQLFNTLGGDSLAGTTRRILFPMVPEYIGYTGQVLTAESMHGHPALVKRTTPGRFRYELDWDTLPLDQDTALVAISRPCNPTGRVASESELRALHQRAKAVGALMMIDGAYGPPFPGLTVAEAPLIWEEDVVLSLSLSKLGLPGVRTGILICHPELAERLGHANALMHLAVGGIGPDLVEPWLRSGQLRRVVENVVRPFYARERTAALEDFDEIFGDQPDIAIHEAEGGFFQWLWVPRWKGTALELYGRLKAKGLLCIPGSAFCPGFVGQNWPHPEQCLRLNIMVPRDSRIQAYRLIKEELNSAA